MIGFLPPSSRLTRLRSGRGLPGDGAAGRHRSDKADAAHIRMAHQRGADLAVAGEDVDDAGGENSVAQFAEPQARQRRLLRTLDHDGIAGGERRRRLLGAEPERMVERIDLGDDAERLPAREIEMTIALRERLALDFGDQPGAIAQPIRGPDHVAAHADDGVARIDGVEQRQFIGVFFDAIGQQLEAARALLDRHARPFLESRLRRLDRRIDIRLARGRNVGEFLHVRRIDRGEGLAVGRRNPSAADIEPAWA